ncbi:MAG: hypothetical protein QG662_760 [Pseudomonadota bacterium]|nr:hypothetical protein [Pseudomonadota bacterium]
MSRYTTPVLRTLLDEHPSIFGEAADLSALPADALIGLYERVFPQVEQRMWQADDATFEPWLTVYQALFREQQALIDASGQEGQHDFVIGIPVAGRPAHLRNCLESILQLCRLYAYGGQDADGRWARVTVIVAEDSREPRHVASHRALVDEYRGKGLRVEHFDLPEQFMLLQAIPEAERRQLGRLLTTQPAERFYQKGQAANRNLCYLKMLQLTRDRDRTLYYLVDSDQSFLVNRRAAAGEQSVAALNYFHAIDRIFRGADIHMLTGKLVGDPPVSPAVMAANFLDDVVAFLQRIAACDPAAACSFHPQDAPLPGDAAYHDMAKLFGFDAAPRHFDYRCPLEGAHDHSACLAGFADRLHAFFFGEHLTRRTVFRYAGPFTELAPARTIYPGNYIVDFEGLKYIIPFGHLRLRMSGPTAGRLIQAEIGARFASANLPMLHRRTAADDVQDEFRPGVEHRDDAAVDIADEFERQFFGDVMLFTVVEWLKHHDLAQLDDGAQLGEAVLQVETGLLEMYASKHRAVNARLAELERWLAGVPPVWRGTPALQPLARFLRNMKANFGDNAPAWRLIQSAAHREERRRQIVDALTHYRGERAAWDRLVTR